MNFVHYVYVVCIMRLFLQNEVLTESFPKIVPLYDGHELKINQNLIMNGLATISIRNMRSKPFTIEVKAFKYYMHTRIYLYIHTHLYCTGKITF